jgi:hypothetical protein
MMQIKDLSSNFDQDNCRWSIKLERSVLFISILCIKQVLCKSMKGKFSALETRVVSCMNVNFKHILAFKCTIEIHSHTPMAFEDQIYNVDDPILFLVIGLIHNSCIKNMKGQERACRVLDVCY